MRFARMQPLEQPTGMFMGSSVASHSEEEGTDPEDSVSFDIGRGGQASGSFVAPFNGIHGWYWENRTGEEIMVELATTGFYSKATTYGPNGAFSKSFPEKPAADEVNGQ